MTFVALDHFPSPFWLSADAINLFPFILLNIILLDSLALSFSLPVLNQLDRNRRLRQSLLETSGRLFDPVTLPG
jgi:hypothetical protein